MCAVQLYLLATEECFFHDIYSLYTENRCLWEKLCVGEVIT